MVKMKTILFLVCFALSLSAQENLDYSSFPSVGYKSVDRPTFVVDTEFLWWTPTVDALAYGTKYEMIAQPQGGLFLVPKKEEALDWGWDPGARVKLGMITANDGWDLFGSWTYFYSDTSQTLKVAPFPNGGNQAEMETLTSSWLLFGSGEQYSRLVGRGSLLLHQIDLDQGRSFWISDRLSFRPFVGLRGLVSHLILQVKGSRPHGAEVGEGEAAAQARQKLWGVGFLGGLSTDWHLGKGFSLFGQFSMALAYGKMNISLKRKLNIKASSSPVTFENFDLKGEDTLYRVYPFGDLGIGLRYYHAFDTSLILVLDAGWEYHTILNYNQLFKPSTPLQERFTDLPSQNGDLGLNGFVLKGRVEF